MSILKHSIIYAFFIGILFCILGVGGVFGDGMILISLSFLALLSKGKLSLSALLTGLLIGVLVLLELGFYWENWIMLASVALITGFVGRFNPKDSLQFITLLFGGVVIINLLLLQFGIYFLGENYAYYVLCITSSLLAFCFILNHIKRKNYLAFIYLFIMLSAFWSLLNSSNLRAFYCFCLGLISIIVFQFFNKLLIYRYFIYAFIIGFVSFIYQKPESWQVAMLIAFFLGVGVSIKKFNDIKYVNFFGATSSLFLLGIGLFWAFNPAFHRDGRVRLAEAEVLQAIHERDSSKFYAACGNCTNKMLLARGELVFYDDIDKVLSYAKDLKDDKDIFLLGILLIQHSYIDKAQDLWNNKVDDLKDFWSLMILKGIRDGIALNSLAEKNSDFKYEYLKLLPEDQFVLWMRKPTWRDGLSDNQSKNLALKWAKSWDAAIFLETQPSAPLKALAYARLGRFQDAYEAISFLNKEIPLINLDQDFEISELKRQFFIERSLNAGLFLYSKAIQENELNHAIELLQEMRQFENKAEYIDWELAKKYAESGDYAKSWDAVVGNLLF